MIAGRQEAANQVGRPGVKSPVLTRPVTKGLYDEPLDSRERALLSRFCRKYKIRIDFTADNPRHALAMLTSLHAHDNMGGAPERQRLRNAVVAEVAQIWGQKHRFFIEIQTAAAFLTMSSYYFQHRNRATSDLITSFQRQITTVSVIQFVFKFGGAAIAMSGAWKAAEDTIKSKSAIQGIKGGLRRAMFLGNGTFEAAVARWGARAIPAAGALIAMIWVSYKYMMHNLVEIKIEIEERHALGECSDSDLFAVSELGIAQHIGTKFLPDVNR